MNLDWSQELERLALKLRKAFGLLTIKEEYEDFKQITYTELSNNIKEAFPYIEIFDDRTEDTYMIKCNKEESCFDSKNDFFEIYIEKSKNEIELLMHEVAHVIFHKNDIPYNYPIGKDSGTWEQELEANYFMRAFLIPEDYFIKALGVFSRNDGTVDLDGFAERFNVQKKLIVERGHDLKIW